ALLRVLGLAFAAFVLLLGFIGLLPLAAVLRAFPRHQTSRRIVYLGTGKIAQVSPRNGANLFLERECSDFDGYFDHMWNVHFPAGARGALELTARHHLIDVDFPAFSKV